MTKRFNAQIVGTPTQHPLLCNTETISSAFIESHYNVGELYMEFLKGACSEHSDGRLCDFCVRSRRKDPKRQASTEGCSEDCAESAFGESRKLLARFEMLLSMKRQNSTQVGQHL